MAFTQNWVNLLSPTNMQSNQHLKINQFSKARRKFVKIGERAEEMPNASLK